MNYYLFEIETNLALLIDKLKFIRINLHRKKIKTNLGFLKVI